MINWTAGRTQSIQLTENRSLEFSNGVTGQTYFLMLRPTGAYTVSWPESVIWAGSPPTQTATNEKIDVFKFVYDGSCYHGKVYGLNYPQCVI